MSSDKLDVARKWLSLGFDLIPIQPNSKKIVSGFGLHQRRIKSRAEAVQYWADEKKFNMAVIANNKNFILDFDKWEIYTSWVRTAAERFTTSMTEHTPRGAHVFLCGDVVQGLQLLDGVEIKKIALVFPSVVDGVEYVDGLSEGIYSGDVDDAFFSLTKSGTPTAYLLRTEKVSPVKQQSNYTHSRPAVRNDTIGKIKSSITVLEVLMVHAPATYNTLKGSGRFRGAVCPFHKNGKEQQASFWIDTQLDIFGCHTCGVHGDAINLFSRITGQDNTQAIKTLLLSAGGGNHETAK
jgi:Zn ribbon nucleic-acid-binding protein